MPRTHAIIYLDLTDPVTVIRDGHEPVAALPQEKPTTRPSRRRPPSRRPCSAADISPDTPGRAYPPGHPIPLAMTPSTTAIEQSP